MYVCVWLRECVSVGVCVGAWFRVSAWRVGAWVCGCVGVFFVFPVCLCLFTMFFLIEFFLFFFFKSFKVLESFKSKLSKTSSGVFSF